MKRLIASNSLNPLRRVVAPTLRHVASPRHVLNFTRPMSTISPSSLHSVSSSSTIPKFDWGVPTRLAPGQYCEMTKTFSASDVYAFGVACGDWNPVHYPDLHAKMTEAETLRWRSDPKTKDSPLPKTGIFRFPKPIVHGMLTSSLIGTVFAYHLPGAIYLQQSLNFRAPVYYDEPVTARIEVLSVDRNRVTCKTTVEKKDLETGNKVVVVDGEAKVMLETLEQQTKTNNANKSSNGNKQQ